MTPVYPIPTQLWICPYCDEPFDGIDYVWHCPVCAHHWPIGRVECWNCHAYDRVSGRVVLSIARPWFGYDGPRYWGKQRSTE